MRYESHPSDTISRRSLDASGYDGGPFAAWLLASARSANRVVGSMQYAFYLGQQCVSVFYTERYSRQEPTSRSMNEITVEMRNAYIVYLKSCETLS